MKLFPSEIMSPPLGHWPHPEAEEPQPCFQGWTRRNPVSVRLVNTNPCLPKRLAALGDDGFAAVRLPATPELIVRDYAEGDYRACRALWAELTEYHRTIYGDPSIGGDDPGAGFDGYLATSQRIGSWVAESHGRVVGLTGLLDQGPSAEVEPVVVTEAARDQGIGRRLISRVVEEARARGYEYLAIRPVARNVAAVQRFHAAGFRALGGHIDLTMDLAARRHEWLPGASLRSRLRLLKGPGERPHGPHARHVVR
jgi:GNAT superfamily N-acetyltransferase